MTAAIVKARQVVAELEAAEPLGREAIELVAAADWGDSWQGEAAEAATHSRQKIATEQSEMFAAFQSLKNWLANFEGAVMTAERLRQAQQLATTK